MKGGNGVKNNKTLAMLICVLLCLTIAISFVFITIETKHDCIGAECQTCEVLQACTEMLKCFVGGASLIILAMQFSRRKTDQGFFSFNYSISTPVSLKDKLIH